MNKVYKLVWSKVRNCWTVASEITKSHRKSKKSAIVGVVNGTRVLLTAAMLVGHLTTPWLMRPVSAAYIESNGVSNWTNPIVGHGWQGNSDYYAITYLNYTYGGYDPRWGDDDYLSWGLTVRNNSDGTTNGCCFI